MIVYAFPAGWYVLLALALVLWVIFFRISKSKLLANIKMGLIILVISFVVELIGAGLGLWTYIPGNWPWILWINYFAYGMMTYSLFKTAEKHEII